VINQVAELCQKVGVGSHPLVVFDPITKNIAGNKVISILKEDDRVIDEIIVKEATMPEVKMVEDRARKWGADHFIAVGGGSVIDIAKLASFNYGVPFISIPTAASHDGIASPKASIKESGNSFSMNARSPVGVLADTSIIIKAPYRMLASGCADVISNLTAILDWELAKRLKGEYYSSSASALAKTAAEMLIENAEFIKQGLEESAWIAVKSLIVSGVAMSVAGSSRPASGAEHLFSHTLDKICPGTAMHGEQCGLGAIMMMYLHGGDWKMIKGALKEIGAPTTAEELGISREKIIEALVHAHELRPERYTILGKEGLTREAAKELASVTGVIEE
jgi:glycerol-1-phosphate dehydrogenase [NAD(P)+]